MKYYLIFFITLAHYTSVAQNDIYKQMIDYSRPGKYHKILADMVGNWSWKGSHFSGNPSPDSNKVVKKFSGNLVRKTFANGRFFIVEQTSEKSQKLQSPVQNGKMIEDNAKSIIIEGYNNVKKKFQKTLINNHLGSDIAFSEGTYDSTTKTITYNSEQEIVPGMKDEIRELFIIHDKDFYTIEYYHKENGNYIKDSEFICTRIKGK